MRSECGHSPLSSSSMELRLSGVLTCCVLDWRIGRWRRSRCVSLSRLNTRYATSFSSVVSICQVKHKNGFIEHLTEQIKSWELYTREKMVDMKTITHIPCHHEVELLSYLGGGVNLTPPPPVRKSATALATAADRDTPFHDFFLSSLTHAFDTKFAKFGPSVARSRDVCNRTSAQNCPKSAICICLCTKHMEITDFLKMH